MSTETSGDTASGAALTPALSFAMALGHRLRQVREERRLTVAEVASRARRVGLAFDGSIVSRIELGQRQVSAAELLLLAAVYGKGVADLLPTERVRFNAAVGASPAQLRAALTKAPRGWENPQLTAAVRQGMFNVAATAERWEAKYPGASAMASADDVDQPVKAAAKRLGVTPDEVLLAADALWGHGLTRERDRRVAALGPTTARGRQARRGHVTRALLDEIEIEIPKLRQPRGGEHSHG